MSDKISLTRAPFGKAMREHFLFDKDWRNMNHGKATPAQ